MSDRTQSAKIQKISASSVRGIHLPTLHSACPGHCPRLAALPGSLRCFHCPKTCSDVEIGHADIGHVVTGGPPAAPAPLQGSPAAALRSSRFSSRSRPAGGAGGDRGAHPEHNLLLCPNTGV